MITSSQQTTLFSKTTGEHITAWTSKSELYALLKAKKAGEFGWVNVRFPCGYLAQSHFHCKEDGEPRFTNARLDPAYCAHVIQQLGHEAGMLLIGDKFEA